MKIVRSVLLALGAAASLSGVALADERPSMAVTEVDAWTFVPLVNNNSGGVKVDGFLALRDKSTSFGDNIVAVWYKRPASGSVWETLTWESTDQWDAIKTVKTELGISDTYDADWPTTDAKTTTPPAGTVVYYKGFVASDPLVAQLDTDPNRDFWIDVLVEAGYKASDVNFDKKEGTNCGQSEWLSQMVTVTEANENAADKSTAPGTSAFISFAVGCTATAAAPPCKVKITSTGAESAWTCSTPNNWIEYVDTTTTPASCCAKRSRVCTQTRSLTYIGSDCLSHTVTQTRVKTQTQKECTTSRNANGTCPNICTYIPSCPSNNPNNDPFTTTPTELPPSIWTPMPR